MSDLLPAEGSRNMSWFSPSWTTRNIVPTAKRTCLPRPPIKRRALSLEPVESRLTSAFVPPAALGQYVSSLYQDLLGRSASQIEIAAWSVLAATTPSAVVVADMLSTTEYHVGFVNTAYQQVLGRLPDIPGL